MPLISGVKDYSPLVVGGVYIRLDDLFNPVPWEGFSYKKPQFDGYLMRLFIVEILPGTKDGFQRCRNLCWLYNYLGSYEIEYTFFHTPGTYQEYEDTFMVWDHRQVLRLHITPEEALDEAFCKRCVRPTLPYFEEFALGWRYSRCDGE